MIKNKSLSRYKTKTKTKTKTENRHVNRHGTFTRIKTKLNNLKRKQNNVNGTTYIISECYNKKLNKLYTDYLRKYLSKLNFTENTIQKESDIRNLEKLNKSNKSNKSNKLKNKGKIFEKPLEKSCKIIMNLPLSSKLINTNIVFIWQSQIDKSYDSRMYKINGYLINMLNDSKLDCVNDKFVLYSNMMLNCPDVCNKHMAKTFKLNEKSKYKFYKNNMNYYILRPIDSYAGKDILYISNELELNNAIKFYNTHKNYSGKLYQNNVIASEYIMNPLLFKGYKFHLRMYYMVSYIDNILNSFFMPEGDILTADKPYTIDKPFTKVIHDTHQTSSSDDYLFPKDLEFNEIINLNDIIEQMKNILKCITKIINKDNNNNNTWLYNNQKNGFSIMGVDFMIDNTGRVILIEINKKTGFGYNKKENDVVFSNNFFKWINEVILEPTFKYKDQTYARKHSTYLQI
jgi:hypothetical protein